MSRQSSSNSNRHVVGSCSRKVLGVDRRGRRELTQPRAPGEGVAHSGVQQLLDPALKLPLGLAAGIGNGAQLQRPRKLDFAMASSALSPFCRPPSFCRPEEESFLLLASSLSCFERILVFSEGLKAPRGSPSPRARRADLQGRG